MIIVAQSGASRQDHQQRARNKMTKTMNYAANKMTTICTTSLKYSFLFQTDEVVRDSLHIFDTQKNKPMSNAITYLAPKTKTMAHIMSLKIGSLVWWESPFLGSINTGI